jgi:hypothetical protein
MTFVKSKINPNEVLTLINNIINPKNIEQAISELMDIASPFKMIKGYIG